jgi:uncharacterized protein YuzE
MAKDVMTRDIRFDYDDEGDVLYISFGEPQAADDADVTDDGVIVRTREGKIVGLTVLNASQSLYRRV